MDRVVIRAVSPGRDDVIVSWDLAHWLCRTTQRALRFRRRRAHRQCPPRHQRWIPRDNHITTVELSTASMRCEKEEEKKR